MFQQLILVGNLGSDPEMRYTPSGVPVANFSLAVNKRYAGQDGQLIEKTTWFRVAVWNKQAETVSQYLSKGRQVLVIGEINEAKPFTDRDGNVRATLEVTAFTVRFLGGPGEHAASPAEFAGAPAAPGRQQVVDEDIPF